MQQKKKMEPVVCSGKFVFTGFNLSVLLVCDCHIVARRVCVWRWVLSVSSLQVPTWLLEENFLQVNEQRLYRHMSIKKGSLIIIPFAMVLQNMFVSVFSSFVQNIVRVWAQPGRTVVKVFHCNSLTVKWPGDGLVQ